MTDEGGRTTRRVLGSIVQTPGVMGGVPVIEGSRIAAQSIAALWRNGHDVKAIVRLYPHLTKAQVEDALRLHRIDPYPISDEEWDAFQRAICDHNSADGIDQAPLSDPEKFWKCVGCGWLFQSLPDPDRPWLHYLRAASGIRHTTGGREDA